ncbi:MAG: hypothetical protein ACOCXH_04205 [Cyclobacteriaceae bacterium]
MKKKFMFLFPLVLIFSCGSEDNNVSEDSENDLPIANVITINENISYQTMDGIGANCYAFPFADAANWSWDDVKYVFEEIDLQYIRLASWFSHWESENDNNDPNTLNLNSEAFDPLNIIKDHDLGFARFLQSRNIEIMLGIWGPASWLANGDPKMIAEEDYDELGESIASYLLYMKQNGVTFAMTEVQNEPTITAQVKYPGGTALTKAAVEVIAQLNKYGFNDVMLHGPNLHSPSNTISWAQPMMANETVKDRIKAISYHTWWVANPQEYIDIANYAAEAGKPVWATEVGFCALKEGCNLSGEQHYLRPETWSTAWDYANSYYRAIIHSKASRVYHWSLLGHDAIVGKNGEKLPSYYIFKQFANFIPPQSQVIEASANDTDVLPMIFKLADGSFSGVIINKSKTEAKRIQIKAGNQVFTAEEVVNNKENEYDQLLDPILQDNTLDYTLPARSITSIRFSKK